MSGKTLSLFFIIFLLSISSNATEIAQEYTGYSEEINQTFIIEYENETYFWIDYIQFFQYSSSLLIKNDTVIRDPEIISLFSRAYIIHKNYEKGHVEQLRILSQMLNQICERLSSLKEECNEISELAEESAHHLELSIDSFSPSNAEKHYLTQEIMIEKMEISLQQIEEMGNRTMYMKNYQDSLKNMLEILKPSQENLKKSGEMIEKRIEMKIKSREGGSDFALFLGLVIVALLILSFIWIKR